MRARFNLFGSNNDSNDDLREESVNEQQAALKIYVSKEEEFITKIKTQLNRHS